MEDNQDNLPQGDEPAAMPPQPGFDADWDEWCETIAKQNLKHQIENDARNLNKKRV